MAQGNKAPAKKGKPKLTEAEKKAREDFLKNESKADRFKRLGEPRINAAIRSIKLLGNLSGSGYEYTPAQVQILRDNLNDAVKITMDKFNKAGKTEVEKVTL